MYKVAIGTLLLSVGLFSFAGCSGDGSTSVMPANPSDSQVAENSDDIFGAAADSTDEAPIDEAGHEESATDEPVFGAADDEPATDDEPAADDVFGTAGKGPVVDGQPPADDIFGAATDSTDEAPVAEPGDEESATDEPVFGGTDDEADNQPAADSIVDESVAEDDSILDEPVDDQQPATDEAPVADEERTDDQPFADPAVDQSAVAKPEMRIWTDSTGLYTREALFVALEDDMVILTKKDGNPARIPLERLSKADQQYVHDLVAAQEAEQPEESSSAAAQE